MKQVVNEHALALHTVTVDAAHGEVELQVYETQSGSYFAIDGSWLEQVPEDDKACYIPDPYNEGYSLQLIDGMEEKKTDLVSGEENQYLIDKVIEEMRKNIHEGDVTAIDELLQFVPEHILKGFLPDCPYCGGDSPVMAIWAILTAFWKIKHRIYLVAKKRGIYSLFFIGVLCMDVINKELI